MSSVSEISEVDPLVVEDWDDQLRLHPAATFFHSRAWARVIRDTYGYQPRYLSISSRGQLLALLPLFEISSWITGRRGVSLPFTDWIQPLCPDQETFMVLFRKAQEVGRQSKWKYLEIRGGAEWLPNAGVGTSYLKHTLNLSGEIPTIFKQVNESTRRAVRRAKGEALQIERSQTSEAMQQFYGLFCRTRRRHGAPPQPFRFFANIWRHVLAPGHGWIFLAMKGGHAVAGAVYFHFRHHVVYKFGGSDERLQQLRANNLVMWSAIEHYASQGASALDFGRTSIDNDGLRRFKLGWGTEEEQLRYFRYDIGKSTFVAAPETTGRLQAAVCRALPGPVFRAAGKLLYRHIG